MDRARIVKELTAHGYRRTKAQAQAAAELDAIAALIPQALAAGMQKIEIAQRAQISRPTIDKLLRDHD